MPHLLQALAERDARYLADLTALVEIEARELNAQEHPQLGRMVLAARSVTGHAVRSADAAGQWVADLERALRVGMSGYEFRPLAGIGPVLLEAWLAVAESAAQLWDHAEKLGAAADELATAREELAAARARILAAKPFIDKLARRAVAKPPDIDPAVLERGAQQIREGKFFTPEQAIEYFRRPRG